MKFKLIQFHFDSEIFSPHEQYYLQPAITETSLKKNDGWMFQLKGITFHKKIFEITSEQAFNFHSGMHFGYIFKGKN